MGTLATTMMVLTLVLGGFAFAVPADAHNCIAQNPQQSCGECLSGQHWHAYPSGTLYCQSWETP